MTHVARIMGGITKPVAKSALKSAVMAQDVRDVKSPVIAQNVNCAVMAQDVRDVL